MRKMRKILLFSMLLFAVVLMACSKEDPQETNMPTELEQTHDVPTEQPAL